MSKLLIFALLVVLISGCTIQDNKSIEINRDNITMIHLTTSTNFSGSNSKISDLQYKITIDCTWVKTNQHYIGIRFSNEAIGLCKAVYPDLWGEDG